MKKINKFMILYIKLTQKKYNFKLCLFNIK